VVCAQIVRRRHRGFFFACRRNKQSFPTVPSRIRAASLGRIVMFNQRWGFVTGQFRASAHEYKGTGEAGCCTNLLTNSDPQKNPVFLRREADLGRAVFDSRQSSFAFCVLPPDNAALVQGTIQNDPSPQELQPQPGKIFCHGTIAAVENNSFLARPPT